jgi:hypothetical protein
MIPRECPHCQDDIELYWYSCALTGNAIQCPRCKSFSGFGPVTNILSTVIGFLAVSLLYSPALLLNSTYQRWFVVLMFFPSMLFFTFAFAQARYLLGVLVRTR